MKSKAKAAKEDRDTFTARFSALRDYLMARAEGFRRVLPEKGATVDRFVQTVLYNVYRTPDLLKCTRGSIFISAMGAAKLGLEPDQVLGHAYLIPFRDGPEDRKVWISTLVIGYRGMAALAWRDAKIMLRASVVRARDTWTWRDGMRPVLEHVPSDAEDPGERVAAWVVAVLPDGRRIPRWCTAREVGEAKKASPGSKHPKSPWNTFPDSMWMKTPVRRIWPFLPVSVEVGRTFEAVEAGEAVPEAMEFSDALDGTPAESDGTFDPSTGPLKQATEAMRDGKGLPPPSKQQTVADVLGEQQEPEGVPLHVEESEAGKLTLREPPAQAAIEQARAAFQEVLTFVDAKQWDGIFKIAGVKAPNRIDLGWIRAQSATTLRKLVDAANGIGA